LLQILVLVAMGAFIPQAGGARGAAFAVATGVLFAILAVLWLLASRGDRPEYRRASRLFVAGTAACAAALVGTAFLPAGARIPAWGLLDVVYLAGFAAAVLASPAQASALLVTDALIERFGLLTIIVLGETVSGVVAGLAGEPVNGLTLATGLAARRGRVRRLVDIFRLRRAPPPPAETGGQPAVDTRPPAAHGGRRRDGRRDGQPRPPRP
jgi:low temperature requirement protein LtrA